jgi:hypothetical protein
MTNPKQPALAELLPCPFCGGDAGQKHFSGPTGERYRWIECEQCNAMSESCDDSARANDPDEPDPVGLWNRRTPSKEVETAPSEGEEMTAFKLLADEYEKAGLDVDVRVMRAGLGPFADSEGVALRAVMAALALPRPAPPPIADQATVAMRGAGFDETGGFAEILIGDARFSKEEVIAALLHPKEAAE